MTNFVARATVKAVELVKAGTWNGSAGGRAVITPDDLQDVVRAAQDPEVDHAPVKLGHVDPRFDGQPAAGWVENLRLSEDGATVIGDLVDVPLKLAQIMSSAFRRRSVELRQGVVTPSGNSYRMALSGLALLGVQAPAVKGLADVLTHYAEGDDATHAGVLQLNLSDAETPNKSPDAAESERAEDSGAHTGAADGASNREENGMDTETQAQLRKLLNLDDAAGED